MVENRKRFSKGIPTSADVGQAARLYCAGNSSPAPVLWLRHTLTRCPPCGSRRRFRSKYTSVPPGFPPISGECSPYSRAESGYPRPYTAPRCHGAGSYRSALCRAVWPAVLRFYTRSGSNGFPYRRWSRCGVQNQCESPDMCRTRTASRALRPLDWHAVLRRGYAPAIHSCQTVW